MLGNDAVNDLTDIIVIMCLYFSTSSDYVGC